MSQLIGRQASGTNHEGFDRSRIRKSAFLPLIWTFIAFSFCFLPFRFYARWRAFRRFFWDDALTVIAWLLALSIGAIATSIRYSTYFIIDVTLGIIPPEEIPPNVMYYAHRLSSGGVICQILLYTCLWCVKFGFLLFFYGLGVSSITTLKIQWWAVTVLTLLCFVGTFPSLPYYCGFGDDKALMSSYCTSEQNLSFISMKVNCSLDVVTDVLVMTIPLNILWRSRIPLRQKLALAGVFCLVLITIAVSIVRATVTTVGVQKQMDVPWVLVWTSVEANVAIIVACVGSFRMLFVQHKKESRPSRNSFVMVDGKPKLGTIGTRSTRATGPTVANETGDSMWTVDEVIVAPWLEAESNGNTGRHDRTEKI